MSIISLIVLVFSAFSFAAAQDVPVVCGDLPEADCAILEQNAQAMLAVESYAFDINANFSISNIPDLPGDLRFGFTGNGAFIVDDMAAIQLPPSEMTAMMSDPEAYAEFVSTALDSLDLEMSLVLTLPQPLVEQSGGQVPSSIPLNIALVDGIGYLNFGALREALGQSGASLPEGWYGLDLAELVTQAMAMGGMDMNPMADMDTTGLEVFTDPAYLSQFMTVERLEDSTAADGAAVATFQTTIDYQALFSDPAFMDLMVQSMQAQGATLDQDELDEMSTLMPQMFQGMTVKVIQTIGLDDFYSRSMEMTFNFDMSPIMAATAEMGDNVDVEGPAPLLMFDLNLNLSDFNAVPAIQSPANATVIPLESLGVSGAAAPQPMMPTATPAS